MTKEHNLELIQVFDDPSRDYRGNIAAVVLVEKLPDEGQMQRMAADLSQPATTFLAPSVKEGEYDVRWFAPDGEIGLCGHGSLAAIAFLREIRPEDEIILHYRNGSITGRLEDHARASIRLAGIPVLESLPVDELLINGLGIPITGYWRTDNKDLVLTESQADIEAMKPDFALLRKRKTFGYTITAPGNEVDFVNRTLVPHVQQLEDPATGSSHAILVPFWHQKSGLTSLQSEQLSSRKGKFSCSYKPDQNIVQLTGHYSVLASGNIQPQTF